ncbi:MAG TPA: heavy metal translocating P-type ATPase [Gemmatimonadaceae bacterium]|nr:heavy metal translocating P-type ATPase [Gemmatimonadaceae bacterium]
MMDDAAIAGTNAGSVTALARSPRAVLAAASIGVIIAGFILNLVLPAWAPTVWLVGLIITGAPIVWRTMLEARQGHWATDVVAVLAIVGAVLLRQPLAGLVIVLMRSGGEALEDYAAGRASAALRELEAAAPRIAHRLGGRNLTTVEDVPVSAIEIGDTLLVRPGELVPSDAIVRDGTSLVDVARLTGEPVPLSATPGTSLLSGSINGDGVLTITAAARAEDSQYAKIVELVRTAQATKAPLVRLADRYAVWFTPATLLVCIVTYLATRDATRVLAVLVVATPCPLILATPIAIIGGISRAARRQIIVRHGGALEELSSIDVALFDKTGTLTIGKPLVRRVLTTGGVSEAELLRLAAAVEQGSSHLLARTLVDAALDSGSTLPMARAHVEAPGRGVTAEVEGHEVSVGSRAFILERARANPNVLSRLERSDVGLRAYVAIDGCLAGAVEYSDRTRPETRELLDRLQALGIERTILLSGDHAPNVRAVAHETGIKEARGDLLPEGKVTVVQQLVREGCQVLMVGDGTNDAPALSAAHVGVALASQGGGGISAEAADVVVLADDLSRVADAVEIGRDTLSVARQSIWLGLGLSIIAMIAASFGAIVPTVGALLQEVIDIASIANALRASRG